MKGLVRVGIAAVTALLATMAIGASATAAATSAVLVKDIAPGAASSNPGGAVDLNGTVLVFADDGVHGSELWKSDGTTAGTALVEDINPGAASSTPCDPWDRSSFFTAVYHDTVFLPADDGVHGCELWKSDGTASGTSLVADINPGPAGSEPQALIDFDGTLFFSADDGVHGREPWTSDGTSLGTRLFKEIVPGPAGNGFAEAMAVDDTLFFLVTDDPVYTLWKTDGTAAGTTFLFTTTSIGGDYDVHFLTSFNGLAILNERAGCCRYRRLIRSDGTTQGTYDLTEVTLGAAAVLNGALYYFEVGGGEFGDGPSDLRRTDGTVEGTGLVEQIFSDFGGVSGLTAVNGRLLFFATEYSFPAAAWVLSLWTSDGTAQGTRPLFDIGSRDRPVGVGSPTLVGNALFFATAVGSSGYELWKTDATAAGTYLVGDINAGEGSSNPEPLLALDGTLFFTADDGVHGRELWKTTPPIRAEPQRGDYRNAASYCRALREFLGGAEFRQRYKNHGKCVSANR